MGKDLLQSRVTKGQIASVVSVIGMVSLYLGYDVGDKGALTDGILAIINGALGLTYVAGVVYSIIGRLKVSEPITSVAGVAVKAKPDTTNEHGV